MSEHSSEWCLTFCTPDEVQPGRHEIQWQFPGYTITCTAIGLGFAQEVLDFVIETRNNPKYRDTLLGDGSFRCMDEKSVDLSKYFYPIQSQFYKWGESDDDYRLRFDSSDGISLAIELRSPTLVDAFIDGIKDIIENYTD